MYYGKKKIGSLDGDIDACIYPQVSGQTNHIFEGAITCWGKNSTNLINTLTMGFDGANGIIEMRGTTLPPEFGSRLLINYYCGKQVDINTGELESGNHNVSITGRYGKVGIGDEPGEDSKLWITEKSGNLAYLINIDNKIKVNKEGDMSIINRDIYLRGMEDRNHGLG